MQISITASVGKKGKNNEDDVRCVYSLFNKIRKKKFEVCEQCSPELIQAIKNFQKSFMSKPDGRIDPDGKTLKKLTNAAGIMGQGRELILSFDDGPAPEKTLAKILNTLEAYEIKAEFYALGKEIDKYPDAARKIVNGGHKIQNHSFNHPNLAKAKKEEVLSQLQKTQESINKATGAIATKIRPPYGAGGWSSKYDPELVEVAESLSLKIQNWDIDTRDWEKPKGICQTKLKMLEKQLWKKGHKNTLNVLMHVQKETARDLEGFIDQLKKWGFTFGNP